MIICECRDNSGMPIPESRRIIYGKNPLHEVVCQLKFPPILRIESEVPTAFQEAVREKYPLYSENPGMPAPPTLSPDALRLLNTFMLRGTKLHEFATADKIWKLTLAKDFIALSCAQYSRWEMFLERFEKPFRALLDQYAPPFFSRIGLRYQNVIIRSLLGLQRVPWNQLLQPYVAGLLNSEIADEVDIVNHQVSFSLPGKIGTVTMHHGLARIEGSQEPIYLIDNDYFSEERSDTTDAIERLKQFNAHSGRVFRWLIKDQLDRAMDPQPVA